MSHDAELLTTMIRASDGRIPLNITDPDLDMLAYDIADTLDRGEYGLGDITQNDIRAVLPAFLIACLANADADADEITTCDRCGELGQSLCEACVNRRNES